ncbi:MAG: type I-A CRISPR-associated protein Cas5a [Candidatus Nezhaarchaeales archaeon]
MTVWNMLVPGSITRRVIVARFRVTLLSIKHELAYQVSYSYPLPPPSTLFGAFAKALGYSINCGVRCPEEARKYVNKIRAGVSSNQKLLKSSAVLVRIRGVLEDKRLPSDVNELPKFKDAMLREYVFASKSLPVLVVPRSENSLDVIKATLPLIDRIGDSESLVAIEGLEVVEAKPCDSRAVTVVVKSQLAKGGSFIVEKATDESGNRDNFAFPVTRKPGMPEEFLEISPIEVNQQVLCADDLCFPQGGDW